MNLTLVKLRRCGRKVPRAWWDALKVPFASAGQLFQALLAYLLLLLLLQTATPEQRDMLAGDWAIWLQALCLAGIGWVVITLLWPPYAAVLSDRRLGKWHGRTFVYHHPLLVATIRCQAGNAEQLHNFKLDDAEAGSMAYCSVELHPPVGHIASQVFGMVRSGNPPSPGSWSTFRVEPDRRAYVYFWSLGGHTPEYTARVYCHQFEMMDD